MVSEEPILVYPDPSKPYVLFMDASKYAWSCVLTQEYTHDIEGKTVKILHPISYCYIVGFGLNCKFIDLLFKRSFIKFIKISLYLNFVVLEIISKQTDTLN